MYLTKRNKLFLKKESWLVQSLNVYNLYKRFGGENNHFSSFWQCALSTSVWEE